MAHLCLLDENGAVAKRWEIGDQPVAVGRDEAADVMVPDKSLSRQHFRIWREGTDFLIKDLNSQNGTWVDGQRANATKLQHNVCIVAGQTVFMFSEQRAAMAAATGSAKASRQHAAKAAA
jgi:two-component system, NtrC family, sensor kinase